MAKDDYFVIVYRLLKYLYDCLKKGNVPSREVLDADFFLINETYWTYIIRHLFEDGYVEGVSLGRVLGQSEIGVKIQSDFKITPKGIQYLEDNSKFQKIKNTMKDIVEVIPI